MAVVASSSLPLWIIRVPCQCSRACLSFAETSRIHAATPTRFHIYTSTGNMRVVRDLYNTAYTCTRGGDKQTSKACPWPCSRLVHESIAVKGTQKARNDYTQTSTCVKVWRYSKPQWCSSERFVGDGGESNLKRFALMGWSKDAERRQRIGHC